MKMIFVFFLLLLAVNANCIAENIIGYDINVEMFNEHPFLVDHERILVIKKDGTKIAEQKIYTDAGSRIPLHLFEDNDSIVFIDANGYWYVLNKDDNRLRIIGWQWNKKLPTNYLGTFRLRKGNKTQTFTKENNIDLKDVYLFKDP